MTEPSPPRRIRRAVRQSGRSVLVLIAGFLITSGLVRLGDGTGLAIAREITALAGSASASSPSRSDGEGPVIEDLLAALRARETRLEEAEARLAEREQTLAVAQEEIDRSLVRLEAAERELEELLAIADTAAEEDLARLTAMYEAMKPAEAAALFDQMDPNFAAGFLGRMRADAAAQVLAGLPPEKAYTLSVVLAGRNAALNKANGG